jgi:hypothetical protein
MLSDMRQTRRQFLKTAVAGSAILPGAASLGLADTSTVTAPTVSPKGLARPPKQPNLLFLWTDQHRGDFVPWAGNTALKAKEFFQPLGELTNRARDPAQQDRIQRMRDEIQSWQRDTKDTVTLSV